MFRDRTNLFLSYRRTVPRNSGRDTRFVTLAEEEEGLMGSRRSLERNSKQEDGDIELKPLAPSIFQISSSLDSNLASIKQRTNELSGLYKKLLITRDSEKPTVEASIDELNYSITKTFEACYVLIKKFDFILKNHQRLKLQYSQNELAIIENYKKNYALKIQDSLLVFRNLQNNYIKFLRNDDEDDDTAALLKAPNVALEEDSRGIEDYSKNAFIQAQQQIQKNASSQLMASREREISKLAMGILEISTIFKEMESLVVDQGSMLDRIDYNIARTAEDLKESDRELVRAQGYQKRTTKCKIIFLLVLIVFALVIALLVRRPGSTTVVHQEPAPPQSQDEKTNEGLE